MTTEKILAALDKPRKLYSILMVVNPSGSSEELQQKLLKDARRGPRQVRHSQGPLVLAELILPDDDPWARRRRTYARSNRLERPPQMPADAFPLACRVS